MSGLVYHLRCPSCGHRGPAIPFGRLPGDDPLIRLPGLDLRRREWIAHRLPADDASLAMPVEALARLHSRDALLLAAAIPDDAGLALTSPLRCPACNTEVDRAQWGMPPSAREVSSLSEAIEATRDLGHDEGRQFDLPALAARLECRTDRGCRPPANHWRLRVLGERGSPSDALRELVEALRQRGSRVDVVTLRKRGAHLLEIPARSSSE